MMRYATDFAPQDDRFSPATAAERDVFYKCTENM